MWRIPLLDPMLSFLFLTIPVLGITDYEALKMVTSLADHFLSPENAKVAASINRYLSHYHFHNGPELMGYLVRHGSTLFAEDVTGTVDR
jgi:hypothetical protein